MGFNVNLDGVKQDTPYGKFLRTFIYRAGDSGSYTPSSDAAKVRVAAIGGGGAAATSTYGGGGAGFFLKELSSVAELAASYAYSVGAGASVTATDGVDTTFVQASVSVNCTAGGGDGAVDGSGGVGSGGDFNANGGNGHQGGTGGGGAAGSMWGDGGIGAAYSPTGGHGGSAGGVSGETGQPYFGPGTVTDNPVLNGSLLDNWAYPAGKAGAHGTSSNGYNSNTCGRGCGSAVEGVPAGDFGGGSSGYSNAGKAGIGGGSGSRDTIMTGDGMLFIEEYA